MHAIHLTGVEAVLVLEWVLERTVEFTRRFVLSFLPRLHVPSPSSLRATSSRLTRACQCTPQMLLIKPQLAEHPLVEAFRNAVSPGYFAMEENEKSSSG